MSKLYDFKTFEKVQPDWFKKNPSFYISKVQKDLEKRKEVKEEQEESLSTYINNLKKLNVNDIEFSYNDEWKEYRVIKPTFLTKISFRFSPYYVLVSNSVFSQYNTEYNYKIILSLLNFMEKNNSFKKNNNEVIIEHLDKNIINPLFKELDNFYALYYNIYGYKLYLTTDIDKYKNKINELKKENTKILYFNNKTKGKEFTDIELVEINKLKNNLKNINIEDIYFEKTDKTYETEYTGYSVKFKDKELNDQIQKYKLISYKLFVLERDIHKVYFGHLRNRYHTGSISEYIQGIGLGYKIYKAFLKFNGYLISDESTSVNARKIYFHLMKDNDVYCIVDKKSKKWENEPSKVMLIWKDFPKLEQLLKIIRTHELKNKRKYQYDKELLPLIKNIKI